MKEVVKLLQCNTTAYHPKTKGLVERLTTILAKIFTEKVMIGTSISPMFWATKQQSTQESPFYLLYSRSYQLPTNTVLTPAKRRSKKDLAFISLISLLSPKSRTSKIYISNRRKAMNNMPGIQTFKLVKQYFY